jgi:hypothetical protein
MGASARMAAGRLIHSQCKLSDVDPRGTKLYINSERIVAVDY